MYNICTKVTHNAQRPEFKFPVPDCNYQLITRFWAQDPDERPTFDEIVEELKTNDEFITDSVDKDEFLDFVDLIDNYKTTFDPSKKFKKITFSKEPQKVVEEVLPRKEEMQKREKIVEQKPKPKPKQIPVIYSTTSSSDYSFDFSSNLSSYDDNIDNNVESDSESDFDQLPFNDVHIDPSATSIGQSFQNNKII
ncbi:hypothetical protein M9Y10_003434 [Tritrichomonas musculus]|uniref:Serine-threonine/tyrosine-protein kinase catalytic domain-containing protein n=1 Tax=Tritrichomonas musculus TaxID=1915356 RepID=A0ABR2JPE4_9EUKA